MTTVEPKWVKIEYVEYGITKYLVLDGHTSYLIVDLIYAFYKVI